METRRNEMKEHKNKQINIAGNGWIISDGEFIETPKKRGAR